MPLCSNCGSNFGEASRHVCLHCGASLWGPAKSPAGPVTAAPATAPTVEEIAILEFLGRIPHGSTPPTVKTIGVATGIGWGRSQDLLDHLEDRGWVGFKVDLKLGTQYFITSEGQEVL